MATQTQVKNYLAYWFQLGKQVVTHKNSATYKPETVIEGDRFSTEFEDCWRDILNTPHKEHYLEGTDQTIEQLLSSAWEIDSCARCNMPVPTPEINVEQVTCPCNDLPTWPNEELPSPRLPIDSQSRLNQITQRMSADLNADETHRQLGKSQNHKAANQGPDDAGKTSSDKASNQESSKERSVQ